MTGRPRPLLNPELWQDATPILRSHDITLTAGFLVAVGFELSALDVDASISAHCGGVRLRYELDRRIDPFLAPGSVSVAVTNADLLHADLFEADVMPDVAEPEDASALHARWRSERDVSRLGPLRQYAADVMGFSLFDPTNNLLRCTSPR